MILLGARDPENIGTEIENVTTVEIAANEKVASIAAQRDDIDKNTGRFSSNVFQSISILLNSRTQHREIESVSSWLLGLFPYIQEKNIETTQITLSNDRQIRNSPLI